MKVNRVNALLKTVRIQSIEVEGKNGPKPAFFLELIRVDGKNVEQMPDEYVVPPNQLIAMCGLLQEILHSSGLAIPTPPSDETSQPH